MFFVAIILLILSLVQYSQQYGFGEKPIVTKTGDALSDIRNGIKNGTFASCDLSMAKGMSNQIQKYARMLYPGKFSNLDNLGKVIESQDGFLNFLGASTVRKIEECLENKVTIQPRFLNAIEFYFYDFLQRFDGVKCELKFQKLLGDNYETCKICKGTAFLIDKQGYDDIEKNCKYDFESVDYDGNRKILIHKYGENVGLYLIEAIQHLMTCNNEPGAQSPIDRRYETFSNHPSFSTSSGKGFKLSCLFCEVPNCGRCYIDDFQKCEKCKYMYDLNPLGNKCIGCKTQGCEECIKNNDTGAEICEACEPNLLLLKDQINHIYSCVSDCPAGFSKTKVACLICPRNKFPSDYFCINCMENCYDCNPDGIACRQCAVGFKKTEGGLCEKCNDDVEEFPPQDQRPNGEPPALVIYKTCCSQGNCGPGKYQQKKYPYKCKDCDASCDECDGEGPTKCKSCKEPQKNELIKGQCHAIVEKAGQYLDESDGELKQCHFTCKTCKDNTEQCLECLEGILFVVFNKSAGRKRCYPSKCPDGYAETSVKIGTQTQCLEPFQPDENKKKTEEEQKKEVEQKKKEEEDKKDKDDEEEDLEIPDEPPINIIQCGVLEFYDGSKCIQCPDKCVKCTSDTSCQECIQGYFISNESLCQLCDYSCLTCKGPESTDCLSCKDRESPGPDENGKCTNTQFEKQQTNEIVMQKEIVTKCKNIAWLSSQNYDSQINSLIDYKSETSLEISDQTACDIVKLISKFKSSKYPSQDDVIYLAQKNNCQNNDVSHFKVSEKGQMMAIYATILQKAGAQINKQQVTLKSLVEYAKNNGLVKGLPLQKFENKFTCKSIQCHASVDPSFQFQINGSTNMNFKLAQEIFPMVQTKTSQTKISCFKDEEQLVTEQSQKEIDELFKAAYFNNQDSAQKIKQYFVIDLCYYKENQKVQQMESFIIKKYLGNNFVEIIVSGSRTEVIYLFGTPPAGDQRKSSDLGRNGALKQCLNDKYQNSFKSYIAYKIKLFTVETIAQEYQKIAQEKKLVREEQNKKLATKIQPIYEFLLANDNNPEKYILLVQPKSNIFISRSITTADIKKVTDKNRCDPSKHMAGVSPLIPVSNSLAEIMFKQYVDDIVDFSGKQCYGPKYNENLCLKILLNDMVYSSKKQCVLTQELKSFLEGYVNAKTGDEKVKQVLKISEIIEKSDWCKKNGRRCQVVIRQFKSNECTQIKQ